MHGTLFKLAKVFVVSMLLLSCSKSSERTPPVLEFTPNQNLPYTTYAGWCGPSNDSIQRYYLRSLFLDFYYWYDDIVDVDPESSNFEDFIDYFFYLRTDELSPSGSGKRKDQFSRIAEQSSFSNLIELGSEIGYGIRYSFPSEDAEGNPTIAFVVDGTGASDEGLARGDVILSADGFGPDAQDEFLDRLFPVQIGQSVALEVRIADGSTRFVNIISEQFTVPSVDKVNSFDLNGSRKAGYLLFNDHTRVSAADLVETFTQFEANAIDELIIDLRYNRGGLLSIANLVASMIAPQTAKAPGTLFEQLIIRNPGNFEFTPTTNIEFLQDTPNAPLPEVQLNKVYVLTGPDTCSASETIINGLRGINVEVVQIGEETCGKPYGFVSFNNCGYTFLPVLFEGVNAAGQGGYVDGFKPANASGFGIPLPGCAASDDFASNLGDLNERLLSTALYHIENNTCPPVQSIQVQLNRSGIVGNKTNPSNSTQLTNPTLLRAAQGLKLVE